MVTDRVFCALPGLLFPGFRLHFEPDLRAFIDFGVVDKGAFERFSAEVHFSGVSVWGSFPGCRFRLYCRFRGEWQSFGTEAADGILVRTGAHGIESEDRKSRTRKGPVLFL